MRGGPVPAGDSRVVNCLLCSLMAFGGEDYGGKVDFMAHFKAIYTMYERFHCAQVTEGEGRYMNGAYLIPYESLMFSLSDAKDIDGKPWAKITPNRTKFHAKFASEAKNPFPVWGYLIHASCWKLFQANCNSCGTEIDIQALFDILRSLPVPVRDRPSIQQPTIDWGHHYEGLGRESKSSSGCENPFPGEEDIGICERMYGRKSYVEPFKVNLLEKLFEEVKQGLTRANATQSFGYHGYGDSFSVLPTEVLCYISQWMRSRDVANLRIASPTFASLKLTDEFWHSRFLPGRDFDWAFEAHDATGRVSSALKGKWSHIWRKVRDHRRSEDLWNRERVWNLASWARELMAQRAESPICHGGAVSSDFEPDVPLETIRNTERRVMMTAGCEEQPKGKHFTSGVRTFHIRRIREPVPILLESMLVSCVKISGKHYISGLKMSLKDGQVLRLGYMHENRTMPVLWKEGHDGGGGIVGFDMAVDPKGIRGLSIISCSGMKSTWVGDWENVPKRILTVPGTSGDGNRCLLTIEADFDALKLTRLTIASRQLASNKFDFRRHHIWLPEVPSANLSFAGTQKNFSSREKINKHRPFTWVLFGGEQGEHLRYITGLTLWVYDFSKLGSMMWKQMILGIEFTYSQPVGGEDSVIFGRKSDFGSHGRGSDKPIRFEMSSEERIVSMEVMYRYEDLGPRNRHSLKPWFWEERRIDPDSKGCSVSGLKIKTSLGREFEYNADHNTKAAEKSGQETLQVQKKGAIVGLFGVLESGVNFRNLGIMTIDDVEA